MDHKSIRHEALELATQQLNHPSKDFQKFLDLVPEIVLLVDGEGTCTWGNSSALKFFGSGIAGRNVFPPFSRESQEGFEAEIIVLGKSEGRFHLENWQLRHDGEKRCLAWSCRTFRDKTGRVIGLVSSGRDITERKSAEAALARSLESLKVAQAVSNTGSWHLDIVHGTMKLSEETYRIFGLPPDSPLDVRRFLARACPSDRTMIMAGWNAALQGQPFDMEHRIIVDGNLKWVRERAKIQFAPDGTPMAATGTVQDITERKQTEEKLRQAAIVLNCIREGVVITDRAGNIIAVNPAFTVITGYEESELIGHNMSVLRSSHHDSDFYHVMWQHLHLNDYWQGEIWNRRKDGKTYSQWLTISAARDKRGIIVNYIGVFTDISPLKEAEARLAYLSQHDALTGLPNRRLLSTHLEYAIERVRRKGGQGAVLFLDLDRFKPINDTFGHHAGDQILQLVARRLRERIRDADMVARLGGDEFLIILEDLTAPADAALVAHELIQRLCLPYKLPGGQTVNIGASVGISLFPCHGETAADLIEHADTAAYKAKRSGRNTCCFHSMEQPPEFNSLPATKGPLQESVEWKEFFLRYEPIMCLKEGRLSGVKVLLDGCSPIIAPAFPENFQFQSEDNGLTGPLWEWTALEAFRQMRKWIDMGLDVKRLSLSLSPCQMNRIDLPQHVHALLSRTGLTGHHLELEIEAGAVRTLGIQAGARVAALKLIGVKITIGNFNMNAPQPLDFDQMSIDCLKIDRNFVHALPGDVSTINLVSRLSAIAGDLGNAMRAEGIETQAQRDLLVSLGCTEGQGIFFSKPLLPDEFFQTFFQMKNVTA